MIGRPRAQAPNHVVEIDRSWVWSWNTRQRASVTGGVVAVAWPCLSGAVPQNLELAAEDLIPPAVPVSVEYEDGVVLES